MTTAIVFQKGFGLTLGSLFVVPQVGDEEQ